MKALLSRRGVFAALLTGALAASTLAVLPASSAQASTGCNPYQAGQTIRSAPGGGRTVALTFDDGPSPFMPQILAVLKQYDVRATFFDTGAHDQANTAILAAAAKAGHLVQVHTWEHQYPSSANGYWSWSYLRNQIAATGAQQHRVTGQASCFFRPPGGFMNNVSAVTRSLGMATVLWSVDSNDWQQPAYTSSAAIATIERNATDLTYADPNHPIVLMHAGKASHEPESQVHSNRSNTVAALPAIINWYRARGYRFVDLNGNSGVVGAPAPPSLYTMYHGVTLRYGSTGAAVVALQNELNRRQFNAGYADGSFGPHTLAAFRWFQSLVHLRVDGIVDADDWAALSH